MTVNVDNDNYRHIENKLTTAAQAIDGNLWKVRMQSDEVFSGNQIIHNSHEVGRHKEIDKNKK